MSNGFYNPYMKKPDYAQGLSGMMNQLMMMYLVGMLGNKPKTTETTGITPLPQAGAGQIAPGMGNQLMQNLPQSGNPQMIQQLLQGLQGMGGLGGMI